VGPVCACVHVYAFEWKNPCAHVYVCVCVCLCAIESKKSGLGRPVRIIRDQRSKLREMEL
jgi:hypothetical protein